MCVHVHTLNQTQTQPKANPNPTQTQTHSRHTHTHKHTHTHTTNIHTHARTSYILIGNILSHSLLILAQHVSTYRGKIKMWCVQMRLRKLL